MAETELDLLPVHQPRRLHFNWILPVLLRPARALREILEVERPVWFTPMLVLSVLAILMVVAGGPIRTQQAAGAVPTEPPPGFEWWSPEQQEQYFAAQSSTAGPLFTYVLPALGELVGVWLTWVLLGSLLHLGLTLAGSRGSNTAALNLTAWASIPIAIRYIVQIVYMLVTQRLIVNEGLSGLFTPTAPGIQLLWLEMLALVDLYVIWRMVLMAIGAQKMSGLPPLRVAIVTVVVVLVVLVLQALPGFLGAQLSGLEMVRPFFF